MTLAHKATSQSMHSREEDQKVAVSVITTWKNYSCGRAFLLASCMHVRELFLLSAESTRGMELDP